MKKNIATVQAKKWRDQNREHYREYQREYQRKHAHRYSRKKRSSKYGISLEEYEALCTSQHNKCAICRKEELKRSLAIDHCHKTNKVRGLLCSKCNRGIGFFSDNIEILEAAIAYLKLTGR